MTHRDIRCTSVEAQLVDFLDRSLPDSAVADLELHLASCETCRALVADLSTIQVQAAALPTLLPARDLWPEINARIDARNVRPLPVAAVARWRLWGAAAGLVAATALITVSLTRREPSLATPVASAPSMVPSATDATPRNVPPTSNAAQLVTRKPDVRSTLSAEIQGLQSVVEDGNNALDPTTLAILQTSLRTIDSAITEAKSALRRDPGSAFLSQQLDRSLERKLGLLRRASLLGARI